MAQTRDEWRKVTAEYMSQSPLSLGGLSVAFPSLPCSCAFLPQSTAGRKTLRGSIHRSGGEAGVAAGQRLSSMSLQQGVCQDDPELSAGRVGLSVGDSGGVSGEARSTGCFYGESDCGPADSMVAVGVALWVGVGLVVGVGVAGSIAGIWVGVGVSLGDEVAVDMGVEVGVGV